MTRRDYLAPLQSVLDGAIPRADFHMHTTWTDGHDSAQALYDTAIELELEAILFSEHARKTSEDWFFDFAVEIRALPSEPCRARVGVEAKVMDFDGTVDTTEAITGVCDLVMASVHRFPDGQGGMLRFDDVNPAVALETELRLSLAVLDNPVVDILGHPFGVTRTRFGLEPAEDQYRQIIEKAAKTKVAFEVNSQYHPEPWKLVGWCREAGAIISLGSNAHRATEVGDIVRALKGKPTPSWSRTIARRQGTLE